MVNLCANNYLGLANHPEIIRAAKEALDKFGFGMASVRFICGTQTLHRGLEQKSRVTWARRTPSFSPPALTPTVVFSKRSWVPTTPSFPMRLITLPSLMEFRLSKAKRYRFANRNIDELETCLKQAEKDGTRFKIIATDGVFSMDGHIANLPAICELAERYDALVLVDDSHATGHLGTNGRGTLVLDRPIRGRSVSSRLRDLNRSTTNSPNTCRVANIALNDAMILPCEARLDGIFGKDNYSRSAIQFIAG